jgi:hypothetical protein
MILSIFVLAVLLLVAAGLALIAAINLVPTDFGFAYVQVAAILLAAGVVTLALGLAARALHRQMQKMVAAFGDDSAVIQSSLGSTAIAATAATAAALAAGAALASTQGESDTASVPVSAPRPEEPESDLFTHAATGIPYEEPMIAPAPQQQAAGEDVATEDSFQQNPLWQDSLRQDSFRQDSFRQVALGEDLFQQDAPAEVTASVEDAMAQTETGMPLAGEEPGSAGLSSVPAPPDEPAAAPGLIADADLAALAGDGLAPLAPLTTLDVVGAYDSGGTRFTMYSDGSVTASGPEGETRFRTLDDLRRHLGTNQG